MELLAEPLDWFFAEHYRHRQLCQMIDEIGAATVFDGERIGRVVAFLGHDLALHVIDEEEDFFPSCAAGAGRRTRSRACWACSRPSIAPMWPRPAR